MTTTRGSNNIGPYQYPEKAVPLFITNAIDDLPLPIYGDGLQMRDYQYVLDHCEGIDLVLHRAQLGEIYNVGTGVETPNIEMARTILDMLGKPHSLLQHVTDRAGHDRRYALDCQQAAGARLAPAATRFDQALETTVRWYVENQGGGGRSRAASTSSTTASSTSSARERDSRPGCGRPHPPDRRRGRRRAHGAGAGHGNARLGR